MSGINKHNLVSAYGGDAWNTASPEAKVEFPSLPILGEGDYHRWGKWRESFEDSLKALNWWVTATQSSFLWSLVDPDSVTVANLRTVLRAKLLRLRRTSLPELNRFRTSVIEEVERIHPDKNWDVQAYLLALERGILESVAPPKEQAPAIVSPRSKPSASRGRKKRTGAVTRSAGAAASGAVEELHASLKAGGDPGHGDRQLQGAGGQDSDPRTGGSR